jgi:hypothetical protein
MNVPAAVLGCILSMRADKKNTIAKGASITTHTSGVPKIAACNVSLEATSAALAVVSRRPPTIHAYTRCTYERIASWLIACENVVFDCMFMMNLNDDSTTCFAL